VRYVGYRTEATAASVQLAVRRRVITLDKEGPSRINSVGV
jgi:hypothetical protein